MLTTPVWDSFAAFCRDEGLDPDAVKDLFRHDPEALADLRGLETGALTEDEFEAKFGARLGLKDHAGLIDSMFAGMRPLPAMVDAVRGVRAGGLRTGLVSNSWSVDHYDRDLLAELFDEVVISAEVGCTSPSRRSTCSPPRGSAWSPGPACSSTTCARTARARRRSA